MKRFKQFFTFVFIFSIFVGVVHELGHDHPNDATCEICLVAHTSGILIESVILASIHSYFESFDASYISRFHQVNISLKSRSPPLL